uniref:Uncharacterized protein n=1 Tax=Arundo donax TaxID=35708 RepID=A0A0A9AF63_ARUDO
MIGKENMLLQSNNSECGPGWSSAATCLSPDGFVDVPEDVRLDDVQAAVLGLLDQPRPHVGGAPRVVDGAGDEHAPHAVDDQSAVVVRHVHRRRDTREAEQQRRRHRKKQRRRGRHYRRRPRVKEESTRRPLGRGVRCTS